MHTPSTCCMSQSLRQKTSAQKFFHNHSEVCNMACMSIKLEMISHQWLGHKIHKIWQRAWIKDDSWVTLRTCNLHSQRQDWPVVQRICVGLCLAQYRAWGSIQIAKVPTCNLVQHLKQCTAPGWAQAQNRSGLNEWKRVQVSMHVMELLVRLVSFCAFHSHFSLQHQVCHALCFQAHFTTFTASLLLSL